MRVIFNCSNGNSNLCKNITKRKVNLKIFWQVNVYINCCIVSIEICINQFPIAFSKIKAYTNNNIYLYVH